MRIRLVSTLASLILGPLMAATFALGQGGAPAGQQPARGGGRGGIITLTVSSTSFPDVGEIPAKYTGQQGTSPQLSWSGAPASTASYVLLMHDIDVAIPAG